MKSTQAPPTKPNAPVSKDDFFIPDLCRMQSVFVLILLTELIAFLFTLVRPFDPGFDWNYLGLISIFGLWCVFGCVAPICLVRNRLSTMKIQWVTTIVFAIITSVVTVISLVALNVFYFEQKPVDLYLFIGRNLGIAVIISGIVLRYFYLETQSRIQKQAELRSRLEALQSRIRPHFLFNSLNSIAGLILIDPEKAEEAILDLSELFRATLRTDALLIPLEEELTLCRRYLNIEQLRLGDRLQQDWQINIESAALLIPPLTLQPLVENAVYHGIQPFPEGGTITINVYENDTYIYLLISNPFTADSNASEHRGNKIAYQNINNRITSLFGSQAVLKSSTSDNRYTVTLRLPKKSEDNEKTHD